MSGVIVHKDITEYYTCKKEGIYIPVGKRQLLLVTCATPKDAKVVANLLNIYKVQVEDERNLRELAMKHCTCEDDGK